MNDCWAEISQKLYKEDNYSRYKEVYDFILSRISKGKSLKILDIGCGDGSLLKEVINKGHDLYGVDISEEQLKIAEKNGIKTQKLNVDSDLLPFSDEFFDTVICSEVIEHVLLPENILKEVRRTLKNGGQFILTTPNLASLGRRFLLLFNRNPFIESSPLEENAVGHLRYFVRGSLLDLVKRHGFKLEIFTSDRVNFNGSGTMKNGALAKLIPSLGRTLIFVLRKNSDG